MMLIVFKHFFSVDEERNYITCLLCKDLVQVVDDAILNNNTISQVQKKVFKKQWLLERAGPLFCLPFTDRRDFRWDLQHCWRPSSCLRRLHQLQLGKCDWFIGQWISEPRGSVYPAFRLPLIKKDESIFPNVNFKSSFLSAAQICVSIKRVLPWGPFYSQNLYSKIADFPIIKISVWSVLSL